ncbi:hypothetical protein DMB42_43750 [Nonomuraea sp. WAC 01424]|nr:hypothetical protein DMB42_43750 [Nonomuraea sp. WAC 01424]
MRVDRVRRSRRDGRAHVLAGPAGRVRAGEHGARRRGRRRGPGQRRRGPGQRRRRPVQRVRGRAVRGQSRGGRRAAVRAALRDLPVRRRKRPGGQGHVGGELHLRREHEHPGRAGRLVQLPVRRLPWLLGIHPGGHHAHPERRHPAFPVLRRRSRRRTGDAETMSAGRRAHGAA